MPTLAHDRMMISACSAYRFWPLVLKSFRSLASRYLSQISINTTASRPFAFCGFPGILNSTIFFAESSLSINGLPRTCTSKLVLPFPAVNTRTISVCVKTRLKSLRTWHSISISPMVSFPLNIEKGIESSPVSLLGSILSKSDSGTGFSSFSFPSRSHLARTAFLATSLRCAGVMVLARAFPPLDAPSADIAFAASLAIAGNNSSFGMKQNYLRWQVLSIQSRASILLTT